MNKMSRMAIFASGSGTNAENITRYFASDPWIDVALFVCNKEDAGVYQRAKNLSIPIEFVSKASLEKEEFLIPLLEKHRITHLVLAGFLLKIPEYLIGKFAGRIVNIHPALLPKYGGKGMYGDRVHQAVIQNGDSESGITIHHVNKNYDEGAIIAQYSCPVYETDTFETLASRIHQLEYEFYPLVIKQWIENEAR